MSRRDDWSDEDAVYFRLHTARFLKGVRGLSDAEFKVYTLLLIRMYEKEEPLPRNDELLATFCAMRPSTFTKALDKLIRIEKIDVLDDGTLINETARREIAWRNRRRDAGRKGGEKSAENREARKSPDEGAKELLRPSEKSPEISKENQWGDATIVPIPFNQEEEEEEEEEEEDKEVAAVVRASDAPETLYQRVCTALRLNTADILPARWMPPTALIDLDRIRDECGLSDDDMVALAEASRARFGRAPDGPRGLVPDARRLAAARSAPRIEAPPPRAGPDRPHRTLTSEERLAAMRRGREEIA